MDLNVVSKLIAELDVEIMKSIAHELRKYVRQPQLNVAVIGNGGSCAIADHLVCDLVARKIHAVSMSNQPTLTAIANDFGYQATYEMQIENTFSHGDCLIAISSSGNSKNIVRGVEAAYKQGATVMTLTGFNEDNRVHALRQKGIHVPSFDYGEVESVHSAVCHYIASLI